MTAINTLQTNDAIHFFSDGAFIDPRTNRMVATGTKVFAFPHARCAIGISGPAELGRSLSTAGMICETIDQVVGDIEAILPVLIKLVLEGWPPLNIGIYIGGFTQDGERRLFKLDAKTTDKEFKFICCDADCWNYSPALTRHSIAQALGVDKADEFDRGFIERLAISDPVAHGMLALEAQRRIKVCDSSLSGGSACTVGAFAQFTSVYADHIESRILKRWPDQIGAPIAPDGGTKVYQAGFGKISYQPQRLVGFKGANDTANGINTGSSSGYAVTSASGYVAPTVTAGANQIPLMTAATTSGVTMSADTEFSGSFPAYFAGNKDATNFWSSTTSAFPHWLKWDFGSAKTIASYTVQARSTAANTPSAWTLQGSSTGSFSGEEVTLDTQSGLTSWSVSEIKSFNVASAAPYRYYRIRATAGSDPSGTLQIAEVTMLTPAVTDNMTLVTAAQTADASVSKARVLLEYDASDSPVLNTDLTAEVTCDGGANWSAGTLVKFSSHLQGGHHGAETGLVSCTPGTSVAARIKTANGKNVPIYGVALSWE